MIKNGEKENLQVQVKKEQQVKSDTKVISSGEYEEYMCLKEQANNIKPKEINRDLSINEQIIK